jgi:chromosomal replication initiation ATPase DnaA
MLSGYLEESGAAFNPSPSTPNKRVTMRQVADDVCQRYGITLEELTSERRTRRLCLPRQEFMALAFALPHTSSPMIGRFLGGRDHATVLWGVKAHWARASMDGFKP